MSYWSRTIHCAWRDEGPESYVATMGRALQTVVLATHGDTVWTRTGQHTGATDLPLTDRGERNAGRLGRRLNGMTFARILTMPLERAVSTCELTGFGDMAEMEADLAEWDYGKYEGLSPLQVYRSRADWELFSD